LIGPYAPVELLKLSRKSSCEIIPSDARLAGNFFKSMRIKALAANFSSYSGLLHCVAAFREKGLVVLTYHRIRSAGSLQECWLDEGVFGPDQHTFEKQIKWLKQHSTLLSEDNLLEVIQKPSFKEHYAVITFDDGYRDNYELAYPVLRAHSAPAIFFVCPGLLDQRRLGWWDIIAYMIKRSAKTSIDLLGATLPLCDRKTEAIRKLTSWMKSRKSTETENLLETLSTVCDVPFPSSAFQEGQLMTWEQIRELSRQGIGIGSHTQTHRVLATLTPEAQRWELLKSKSVLEERLGQPVRTVAYPAGSYHNFTPTSMKIARECGYDAAFSFHTGGNRPGQVEPYDLHRIFPSDDFDAMFRCGAMLPNIFTDPQPKGSTWVI
jgi:peptidoglycan/xylan/chitin deacetylase (PgdA/CDA1 family)